MIKHYSSFKRGSRLLGYHGGGGCTLILPVGRKFSGHAVISSQTVDTAFNKNKTEFRILVLSVYFQVLTYLDSLFDKHVKILRDFRSQSISLKDAYDLLTSDTLNLSNTVRIPQNHTDLTGGQTLFCQLANLLLNISSADLEP